MSSHSQFQLLTQKRFGPFFITQFMGAFNDNIFVNALVILIAYQASDWSTLSSNTLINLSKGLFILPFFFFSPLAGQLADKYEKSLLIRQVKLLEVAFMLLAALGFYLQSLSMLIFTIFLMGAKSSLFGPVKYSIIPQVLDEHELTAGNALVEMGTFLAILLGTILGGFLIGLHYYNTLLVSIAVVGFAFLGWFISWRIPRASAPSPNIKLNWNIFAEIKKAVRFAREDDTVFKSILGISWFWFYGAIFLAQTPNFTKLILGGNEHVVTLLLASFSIGIGIGSLLCKRLSGDKIEIGLVPLGAIGLSIIPFFLYFVGHDFQPGVAMGIQSFLLQPGSYWIVASIVGVGIFGGIYVVPLYVTVQFRSVVQHRARIIAANNIINSLFMVMAALVAILVLHYGYSILELFFLVGILNIVITLYIFIKRPEFISSFLQWIRTCINKKAN